MEENLSPVLEWVLRKHPDTPRSRAKEWIIAGRVSVGGVVCRKPHEKIPDPGGTLVLRSRQAIHLDCGKGWVIHPRVSLLYLDSALAIVNKGPGLLSVPGPGPELSALSILADFLSGKLRARGKALPAPYRRLEPLPVHRLDQYTSGVFCMATNASARHRLIGQLQEHAIKREYVAFVEGRPPQRRGAWRSWLKLSDDELRQQVVAATKVGAEAAGATEAITRYEVITEYRLGSTGKSVCKLRLWLETGLKHQIRVQAAEAGMPLIGDRMYHPAVRLGSSNALAQFPRQALHAEVLSLEHPEQPGTRLSWTAQLPPDLRELQRTLHSGQFT